MLTLDGSYWKWLASELLYYDYHQLKERARGGLILFKLINKYLLQQYLALQGEKAEPEVEVASRTTPHSSASVTASKPYGGLSFEIFYMVLGLLLSSGLESKVAVHVITSTLCKEVYLYGPCQMGFKFTMHIFSFLIWLFLHPITSLNISGGPKSLLGMQEMSCYFQ